MGLLPEPRRFAGAGVTDPLLDLVGAALAADESARPGALLAIRRAIEERLQAGDEQSLRQAQVHAPGAAAHRVVSEALARSVDSASGAAGEVVARAFAIPLVVIAGAAQEARISGRLGDVGAIQALLEKSNGLGASRNFGLSNALCSLDSLQAVSPLALYRATRSLNPQSITGALPPEEIVVARGHEQTHLRFLAGASIAAGDTPAFTETGANIGAWGRECANLIAKQLAEPGVQLLVVPRAPRDILSAADAGRIAQLDVAFNLFASNAVRRFRMSLGDPVAIVSAHEGGEVRITLSSPFADDPVEGFRWPLHPADALEDVERLVLDLLADMRMADVRVLPRLLPSQRDSGVLLHPRSAEWDGLAAGLQH